MKGDFTHFTHRPEKRYTRVLEQQGRVRLDADFNEWVEIVHHLERTEAIDVIGRCGVPKHGGGFEIDDDGDTLTISRGRIYVDGILCSNETEDESDPILLGAQPDLPEYDPSLEDDGTYLVYLDVWERHVTAVEDPELREVALGGPDTTTRTRTVCQVKVDRLEDADAPLDDLECVPFGAPSSTGRLAAQAEPTEEASDPCALPAKAGYRGLENRLYRVEIHDPSGPTFKWSRDNGSVVLPITKVEPLSGSRSRVTVETLGRDEVLTVREGDWVEVLGDEAELHGEPGTLAQIASDGIDRADREITLDADVTAHNGERHLKLRRWDHDATDDVALQDGALPIQTTWFELEDGVEIQFDGGATYQVGDYWVIPARTRVGDVLWPEIEGTTTPEPKALPRLGIEHHYCTLALARRVDGEWTEVRDCRPEFPPLTELEEGCCTVVVAPGENIQKAIDSLPPEGGCVCLKTGEHAIDDPVEISRSNVHLHGESSGARVVRHRSVHLLEILDSTHITVDGIHFEAGGEARGDVDYLVTIDDAEDVRLLACTLELSVASQGAVGVGVIAREVEISTCTFLGLPRAIEAIGSSHLAVLDNRLEASDVGETAVSIGTFRGGSHRVVGNHIEGYAVGVQLGIDAETFAAGEGSLVADNRVVRRASLDEAEEPVYGIDVTAVGCTVRNNHVEIRAPQLSGIRVSGADARIDGNRLIGNEVRSEELPVGMFVGPQSEESFSSPDRALILHNRLTGLQHAILVTGTEELPVAGVRVIGNRIDGSGAENESSLGIGLTHAIDGCVQDNQIADTGISITARDGRGHVIRGNNSSDGAAGIYVEEQEDLTVVDNVVENMSRLGIGGSRLTGTAAIRGCRIQNTSYLGFASLGAIGVGVLNALADRVELSIESCEIVDTGISGDHEQVHQPSFGIWGVLVDSCQITDNVVSRRTQDVKTDGQAADRALFLIGRLQFRYDFRFENSQVTLSLGAGSAQITDNRFVGPGLPNLVDVGLAFGFQGRSLFGLTFERTIFAHNDVLHLLPVTAVEIPTTDVSTIDLAAADETPTTATIHFGLFDGVIQGNQVKSALHDDELYVSVPYPSMNFNDIGNVTLLGNITTGRQIRLPNVTPTNPGDFNVLLL